MTSKRGKRTDIGTAQFRSRMRLEAAARAAVGRSFPEAVLEKKKVDFDYPQGPEHEFDIYAEGVVIGGVSTGTFFTAQGNANTACRDRACAELLWLMLWRGPEKRKYVATDRLMAEWLIRRFARTRFYQTIEILHYDSEQDKLVSLGHLTR